MLMQPPCDCRLILVSALQTPPDSHGNNHLLLLICISLRYTMTLHRVVHVTEPSFKLIDHASAVTRK